MSFLKCSIWIWDCHNLHLCNIHSSSLLSSQINLHFSTHSNLHPDFKASLSRVCVVCRFLYTQPSSGLCLTYKKPYSLITLTFPFQQLLSCRASHLGIGFHVHFFSLCWDISGLSLRMYSACCQQWVHCSRPIKSQKHWVVVIHFPQTLTIFSSISLDLWKSGMI